ncbi:RCC1 domain-containing protein [Paenibacillus oceani]|uniref:Ig-like domain-containing protein n=1 Tax=Paenibacillus oceani TaxID=2772510 RepID=A0A927C9J8_9BACL|nr:Ig-like domain-containing protein [Paenibacillus oceani]MBD2863349.1 Ig-like domain-containing protein [Paenibacillus oceani]
MNLLKHRRKLSMVLSVGLLALLFIPFQVSREIAAIGPDLAVVASTPEMQAGGVSTESHMTLVFNQALHNEPVLEFLTLEEVNGSRVSVTASVYANVMDIFPITALKSGTSYRLSVAPGSITSLAGETLPHAFGLEFVTEPNHAPMLLHSNPVQDQKNVAPNQTIELVFNQDVVAGGQYANIRLSRDDQSIPYAAHLSGAALYIDPATDLEPSVTYSVYLPPGSVMGVLGSKLEQGTGLTFTVCSCRQKQDKPAKISANTFHNVLLDSDGTLLAWGLNSFGQLGNGTTASSRTPVRVLDSVSHQPLNDISEVGAGYYYSLALKKDGTVWSWGNNDYGQLGDGTKTSRSAPVQVKTGPYSGLSHIVAISAGDYHAVALKSDGTVWAWGYNSQGQLGVGTTEDEYYAVQVHGPGNTGGLGQIAAVAAGAYHTAALKSDGTVWTWGYNEVGSLGNGTTENQASPVQVVGADGQGGLGGIAAISAGYHTVALSGDGTVWSWGYNKDGQLGDGTSRNQATPVRVRSETGSGELGDIAIISAGAFHTTVQKNDGTLWNWGSNQYGQLGDGTASNRNLPAQVTGIGAAEGGSEVVAFASGGYHTIGLVSGGRVQALGNNSYGQWGDGSLWD